MRFGWTAFAAVFVAGAGVVVASACGLDLSGTCAEGACGSSVATGDGGSTLPDGAPAGGDATTTYDGNVPEASPDPDVLVPGAGIYVAPTGDDTKGTGTQAAPVKSIARGIALAAQSASPRFVYVCSATYTEQVVLDAAHDGVSLFGGFACPNKPNPWSRDGALAKVEAPGPGVVALHLDALNAGATIEDMGFAAAAGKAPGESSVATLVTNSLNVTLRRVTLTARDAQPGKAGSPGSNYGGATAPNGNKGSGQTGGTAKTCVCTDATSSTGGKGGDGDNQNPTAGDPGLPALGGGAGGAKDCNLGFPGTNALNGAGGVGATTYGTIGPNGWTPSPGLAAPNASVGPGGGGGGGDTTGNNGGAGSGGCGGCGGAGGSGGQGGGGSIALASLASQITLDTCTLVSGKGGNGAKGGDGQVGQKGAPGADGATSCSNGNKGGSGGNGGDGAGGGGGAGGVSVGVVYQGTMPTLSGTLPQVGAAGGAGPGGIPLGGLGVLGTSLPVLQVP